MNEKKMGMGEGHQWLYRLLMFHEERGFLLCCCYFNKTTLQSAVLAGTDPTAAVQERVAATPKSVWWPETPPKQAEKIRWEPSHCDRQTIA